MAGRLEKRANGEMVEDGDEKIELDQLSVPAREGEPTSGLSPWTCPARSMADELSIRAFAVAEMGLKVGRRDDRT